MQLLEVSGAVRHMYTSYVIRRLKVKNISECDKHTTITPTALLIYDVATSSVSHLFKYIFHGSRAPVGLGLLIVDFSR